MAGRVHCEPACLRKCKQHIVDVLLGCPRKGVKTVSKARPVNQAAGLAGPLCDVPCKCTGQFFGVGE